MLSRLRSDLSFLFILVIAVFILFRPALLNPSLILHPTFSQFSDIMIIHWPKAHLMAQSWHSGNGLPHWTPLILSGMPLAANQLAMLAYPPAWLFLVFPIEPVFNFLFIFHILLGGMGIYYLLREALDLTAPAALLGSLTFTLSGKWLAHAAGGHVSMVGAVAWMPWALLGMHKLLQMINSPRVQQKNIVAQALFHPGLGWALLVAFALTMQITTHTLPVIYTSYLLGAMVVWQTIINWQLPDPNYQFSKRFRAFAYSILWLMAILALAALLGGGQLFPLLELIEFSNRSLDPEQAAEFSVSPGQLLVGLLLPSIKGGHEFVIYLGLIPLVLAPFGLSRHNRWSWFYGGVLLFTFLFAMGPHTPVHTLFYQFAPGFGWVRTPARIFFVAAVAAAILVGIAIERLASVRWSSAAKRWITRLALGTGAPALLFGLGLAFGFNQMNRQTLALAIFVPATLLVITLRVQRVVSARVTITLLGLALFVDLASFDMSMMKFVPLRQALAPGQPVAEYLSQKPGLFRIYSPSYSLPMQSAAAHNLLLADGVEPVHLSIYDTYMARAGGYSNAGFSVTIPNFGAGPIESALQTVEPNLRLLGLLNVKYLAAAFPMNWTGLHHDGEIDDTFIYTNQYVQPPAKVVYQTIPTAPDWLAQLETLPDMTNMVTIESNHPLTGASLATPAVVSHYSADLIKIETDISEPGWLVLSEIWYPGWQATVNGVPHPVERVNGLQRGIFLDDPGFQQINVEYRPKTVVWGNRLAGVTAVSLLILAGLLLGVKTKNLSG